MAKSTVEKYRVRRRKPPSPTWRAFPINHVNELVSLDFFTVSTVRFEVLFVLIILAHNPRRIVHFSITEHPAARWTAQRMIEAFPWDTAPRFLLRDREGVYGADCRRRVQSMGIEEVIIAARNPWQSPYVERMIGSVSDVATPAYAAFHRGGAQDGFLHSPQILRSGRLPPHWLGGLELARGSRGLAGATAGRLREARVRVLHHRQLHGAAIVQRWCSPRERGNHPSIWASTGHRFFWFFGGA